MLLGFGSKFTHNFCIGLTHIITAIAAHIIVVGDSDRCWNIGIYCILIYLTHLIESHISYAFPYPSVPIHVIATVELYATRLH